MSFKRRVLSALGKAVLPEIGRGLDLELTVRMNAPSWYCRFVVRPTRTPHFL